MAMNWCTLKSLDRNADWLPFNIQFSSNNSLAIIIPAKIMLKAIQMPVIPVDIIYNTSRNNQ